MLLNAFDVDPGAAERTLELQAGELFGLGLQADVLVVSAWRGSYTPVPGTLVHRLQEVCGLDLARCPRALDCSDSPVGAWISPPLDQIGGGIRWSEATRTRFSRIAVVESPHQPVGDAIEPWPVFQQLFSLLALLPLQGIQCPVVATPLLSAGNQQVAPRRLFPALLASCRSGFRHVPDLERLIVFDRQQEPLQWLATQIDVELGRNPADRQRITLDGIEALREGLLGVLAGFGRLHPQLANEVDLHELQHLIADGQVSPVALGLHSRRLVELLVRHKLGWRRGTLYQGLQSLQRADINPWILSCLHQVRVFGNWMGHPSPPDRQQAVSSVDITTMMASLQRVLECYPWP